MYQKQKEKEVARVRAIIQELKDEAVITPHEQHELEKRLERNNHPHPNLSNARLPKRPGEDKA